jgi:hypothetical protein
MEYHTLYERVRWLNTLATNRLWLRKKRSVVVLVLTVVMEAVKNWRKACWKSVAKNNDISKKRPNSLRSQCAPFCLPLHSPPERGLCPPFPHSVAIEELDFWLTHSLGNHNRRVCATAWTADEAVGDPWHLFLRPRCTYKNNLHFFYWK